MDIQCPRCQQRVPLPGQKAEFNCSHCGTGLQVESEEAGFALVGLRDAAGNDDPGAGDAEVPLQAPPVPGEDPVLDDYTRWRTGAVFAMMFGFVCLFLLVLQHAEGLWNVGGGYLRHIPEQGFTLVIVALVMLFGVGGAGVYLMVGRDRRNYLARHQQSTQNPAA